MTRMFSGGRIRPIMHLATPAYIGYALYSADQGMTTLHHVDLTERRDRVTKEALDMAAAIESGRQRPPRIMELPRDRAVPAYRREFGRPRREDFEDGLARLIAACAEWCMGMDGLRWEYEISRYHCLDLVKPINDRDQIVTRLRPHPREAGFYLVHWDNGQITAVDDARLKAIEPSLTTGKPIYVVGVPQQREVWREAEENEDTRMAFALAMLNSAAQGQQNIGPIEIENPRVCPYCAGRVPHLAGVDQAVMNSILGCEACGTKG